MKKPPEIVIDYKNKKITFGKMSFDYFMKFPRETDYIYKQRLLERSVGSSLTTPYRPSNNKVSNQFYAALLGPRIHRRLDQAMYKTFIQYELPKDLHYLFYKGKRKLYEIAYIELIQTTKEKVIEAYDDGLYNIIPFVFYLDKTPKELKKIFGKSLWKTLCKNSKTRNKYIAQILRDYQENSTTLTKNLVNLRSGILKLFSGLCGYLPESFFIAGKITPTVKRFYEVRSIITDTKRMSRELPGHYCNPDWSYARWVKEHDKLIKRQRLKNLSKYNKKTFCEKYEDKENGYSFTLLTSEYEVREEGHLMGHCVGSYSMKCKRGHYLVFRVEGPERATLGCQLGYKYSFNQMYARYNNRVSDKAVKAAKKVIERYNDVCFKTQDNRQVA